MLCYVIKLKVLAFGGLGEFFNNSLATEKLTFRQLTVLTQDQPLFFIWVKNSQVVAFGGLGEAQNISLATEKGCLHHIKKECNI